MKRSLILTACVAFLAATATSFLFHEHGIAHLKRHFISDARVRLELGRTIEKFNQIYASFYVTGGNTFALNEFPAGNLVKRRIFQDINLWNNQHQWLIHDMHKAEVTRVQLMQTERAVVDTRELWDMWLRDTETGMKTGRRTQAIQVRYYLAWNPGGWVVGDFEVYGDNEKLPELPEDVF